MPNVLEQNKFGAWKPDHGHVETDTLDLDKLSGRWMGAFKSRNSEGCRRCEHPEDQGDQ
jgi:hypothetical protein